MREISGFERNLGLELKDKAKENEIKVLALKLREHKSQHFDVNKVGIGFREKGNWKLKGTIRICRDDCRCCNRRGGGHEKRRLIQG